MEANSQPTEGVVIEDCGSSSFDDQPNDRSAIDDQNQVRDQVERHLAPPMNGGSGNEGRVGPDDGRGNHQGDRVNDHEEQDDYVQAQVPGKWTASLGVL